MLPRSKSVAPRIHVRNGIPGNTASNGIVGSAMSPPAKNEDVSCCFVSLLEELRHLRVDG